MRVRFLIMVLAAGLAGCAVPPPVPDRVLQGNVVRLQRDQEALSLQMQRLQDGLLLVEARVQDQQRLIGELRQGLATQRVSTGGDMAEPSVPAAAPGSGAEASLSPAEIYRQAFADYASSRFQRAIAGFESFLSRHPESDYAGNAQYWLGECYYSLQRYERSAEEFGKMVEQYPQGSRTPEALLKMASALLQTDRSEQAGMALQVLRERYPDSAAARKSLESDEFSNILQE